MRYYLPIFESKMRIASLVSANQSYGDLPLSPFSYYVAQPVRPHGRPKISTAWKIPDYGGYGTIQAAAYRENIQEMQSFGERGTSVYRMGAGSTFSSGGRDWLTIKGAKKVINRGGYMIKV
jgi:hypothetical protein